MLEVLGYFVIAAQEEERHTVMQDKADVLPLPDGKAWRLPRILFGRHAIRRDEPSAALMS